MKDPARPATSEEFRIEVFGVFELISAFNFGVRKVTYKTLFYTNYIKIVISSAS